MIRRACFLLLLLSLSVSASLAQRVASISTPHYAKRTIIFKLRSGAKLDDVKELHAVASAVPNLAMRFRNSAIVQAHAIGLDRTYQLTLNEGIAPQDAVRSLQSSPLIEYAEPNYIIHVDRASPLPSSILSVKPNDSLYADQWWLSNVHAPEAWDVTKGDTAIHIGFVDTGVEWTHPDLENQFAVNPAEDINHNGLFDAWPSTEKRKDAHGKLVTGDLDGIDNDGNGYVDDVIGYNFVDQESLNVGDWTGRDPFVVDENGHGTSVAGVLAAEQNNQIGVSGLAPGCRLVALKAFDATGNAEDDDIASAIVYAADNHVRALNLSFGDIVPSLMQRDAIRYATALGCLVCASSGNSGGDAPHYPSDFDEAVSVGGTSDYPEEDVPFSLTTHGEGMDVVAPGQDVVTTARGRSYASVAGTSVSSPIATATAALLFSKNPTLTPLEVRSIIESSTQDVSERGYDHQTANGRVDAGRALHYHGAAAIAISSPHTLDEIRFAEATVPIMGSAASSLFQNYALSYARGDNPDARNTSDTVWTTIASSTNQVLDGLLGSWEIAGLDSGSYTVRLAVHSSDNRSTEQRTVVHLYRAAPKFTSLTVDSVFVNEDRGLLILANSDIPTQLDVAYANGDHTIAHKRDDRLGREHAVLIKREECPAGTPISIEIVLRTPNGDSVSQALVTEIANQAVSQSGFIQKPYALPAGYALDTVLEDPSGPEVAESVFPDGLNFGQLKIFTFDGKKFKQTDSLPGTWIPRGIGNTQGTGKPELLVQVGARSTLYKGNDAHPLLGDVVYTDSPYYAGALADLDHDGRDEVIGYYDSVFKAVTFTGGAYTTLGTMPNNSPRDIYNSRNLFAEPNVGVGDFRGNGTNDVVTLDLDADLIVYERDARSPTGFSAVYLDSNVGQAEGSLVTVGDFDGDGKPDIAFAYHSLFEQDTLDEYPPAFWTLKVLRNLGGMTFTPMYVDHFYFARPLNPYRASVRKVANVTGRSVDDLVCSFFPNFYLIEYDTASRSMRPIWHFPVSISPRGAIAYDFDKNGRREFGFLAGDSIRFFERNDGYPDRTASPAGLNVSPRDTNRVDLEWGAVPGATKYYILRDQPGSSQLPVIDSTSLTWYSDTNVVNGDTWTYSVVAVDARHAQPESMPALSVDAFVHPTPRIVSVRQSGSLVIARTSEPVRTTALSAGSVLLDERSQFESAIISNDSEIVLALAAPIAPGDHRLQVTSFALRDIYNSPFDTATSVSFTVTATLPKDRFYIVRWSFDESNGKTTAHVIFNETPADDALDVTRYTLTPYGSIARVYRDPSDSLALFMDLGSTEIHALGVPFQLCVHNITNTRNTPLDTNATQCMGITLTEPDLTNAMVYPNPAKQSIGSVTFARLTAHATIRIYTLRMKLLRQIATSEEEGGVTWDMRDENGKLVPSGEYLFFATGKDASGADVPGVASKFVIVQDLP